MSLKNRILDIIPIWVKHPMHIVADYIFELKNDQIDKLEKKCNQKRIILFGVPEHGNIGDQAIAYAEHMFFKKYFPNTQVIEITSNCFKYRRNIVIKSIHQDDVIVITGGGSIGSLWLNENENILNVICSFPDNKVVIFPQTVFFDSEYSEEFVSVKNVMQAHKDLLLCLREQKSYDYVTSSGLLEQNKCLLVPDIVLFCKVKKHIKRDGHVLIVLRDDKEKILEQNKQINDFLSQLGEDIRYTDTVVRHLKVVLSNRRDVVHKKLDEFAGSKMVITDRLHGMIFAAITGTPCIAFDNISGKVEGVFKWIENNSTVKFVHSVHEMQTDYKNLLNMSVEYDNSNLLVYFEELAERMN